MSIPPLPQQPSQPETLHFNGVLEENHNNQQQSLKNAEKLLSEWSANMKIISHSKFKKVIIMIKGTLLSDDKGTVLEKAYNAGDLKFRKEANLVKTTKGIYRLIGTIIGGSPNKLYESCVALRGIPSDWKKLSYAFLKPKSPSPSPSKSSFIINNKRSYQESNNSSKGSDSTKQSKVKTVNNSRVFNSINNSSLRSCQKSNDSSKGSDSTKQSKVKTVNNSRVFNSINNSSLRSCQKSNDSSKGSDSTKQSKVKTVNNSRVFNSINNSSLCSYQESNNSSKGRDSTKQSKKKTVNNSKTFDSVNNRSLHSHSIRSENHYATPTSTVPLHSHIDLSKNKPFKKLSVTTSKNSLNRSKKSKQKKNITNNVSSLQNKLSLKKINQEAEAVNILPSLKKDSVAVKKISNKIASQQKKTQSSSSASLFGNFNVSDIRDNSFIITSPSDLSPLICHKYSMSETPHFFTPRSSTPKPFDNSDPSSPINRSIEAKALKRVKAPKITQKEEKKFEKMNNKMKKGNDFNSTMKKLNQLLKSKEYCNTSDED